MIATLLVTGATMPLLAACGDGGDDEANETAGTSTAPAGGSATAVAELKAIDLVPDLSGEGYDQTVPENIPNTGALDIAFSQFRKAEPAVEARAEVRVYPTEEIADEDFEAQAQGWKTPPPSLFGGDPGNLDAPALEGMDDAVGYIASKRDPQGVRLWTDVYRIGRVIVVAHVLGQTEDDVNPVRRAISGGVRAKLP